jgi:methanogenic corrinoid protein MtbC1
MESHLNKINLRKVIETTDETDLKDQVACSGGACEIV